MKRIIKKVAVVGSGIMGSGIACHLANIGLEVLLLDIAPNTLTEVEEKKGLELLFEALSVLTIPWQLAIAGNGDKVYVQSLKALASKLAIGTKIEWLGHINNEDKFKLMANKQLLALTSYNENFANVVIESLAMGTPVLVSEEVGLADYVREHQLGWVTALKTVEISENIATSYHSISKRTQIRIDAPAVIRNDFASQHLVKQYTELYNGFV